MTDNHTAMVVAALRVAIAQQHPEEDAREHEIRLANALRGVLDARAIAYSEELYPEAVRSLVPGLAAAMPVVLDPTPRPELDQTALANRLLGDLRPSLVERAVLELTRWLERQGLQLGVSLQMPPAPAGHIPPMALSHVREQLASALQGGLDAALDGLVFCPGEREPNWKHQAPRVRVY